MIIFYACATRGLRKGRERPGALLARRTRTVKLCWFDARNKGQPWPLPLEKYREFEGSLSTRAVGDQAGDPVEYRGEFPAENG
jgi:hypothetical protein